jgi:hypothetical protein
MKIKNQIFHQLTTIIPLILSVNALYENANSPVFTLTKENFA